MLNQVTMMGRLTRDPELRRTGSGIAVANFSIAVDRDIASNDGGEKETDFFDCVAWRQTGEFVSKYFTKGSMIAISGRLQNRSWKDKDGNNRRTNEVVVNNAYFGSSKSDAGASTPKTPGPYGETIDYANSLRTAAPAYGGYATPAAAPASDFAMLEDDDSQLPF